MSNNADSPEASLIATLESAAGYNDKGYIWLGHSPSKVADMEREFQRRLVELAAAIAGDALGQELSGAIASGAASRDASGEFASIARRRFAESNGR